MFERIAAVAWRQHGAFTTGQATDAGITRTWLSRAAADGRIERRRRGVYVLSAAPRTWRQDLMVEVLAAGDGALATGDAAGALWCPEIEPPRIPVVVVGHGSSRRSSSSSRVVRARDLHLAKPGVVDGIPTVGVARAIARRSDRSVGRCGRRPYQRLSAPPADVVRRAGRRTARPRPERTAGDRDVPRRARADDRRSARLGVRASRPARSWTCGCAGAAAPPRRPVRGRSSDRTRPGVAGSPDRPRTRRPGPRRSHADRSAGSSAGPTARSPRVDDPTVHVGGLPGGPLGDGRRDPGPGDVPAVPRRLRCVSATHPPRKRDRGADQALTKAARRPWRFLAA